MLLCSSTRVSSGLLFHLSRRTLLLFPQSILLQSSCCGKRRHRVPGKDHTLFFRSHKHIRIENESKVGSGFTVYLSFQDYQISFLPDLLPGLRVVTPRVRHEQDRGGNTEGNGARGVNSRFVGFSSKFVPFSFVSVNEHTTGQMTDRRVT